jgi:RNA-binding protein
MLSSSQRAALRRQAHDLKPVVMIGKNGMSDQLIETIDRELTAHELIKVKFVAFQDEKREIMEQIVEATGSDQVGMVGNVAILFREGPDPARRKFVASP